MKKVVFLSIGLFLLTVAVTTVGSDRKTNNRSTGTHPAAESSITVQTTQDLYAITAQWAIEYARLRPEVSIKVLKMTTPGQKKGSYPDAGFSFVSQEFFDTMKDDRQWSVIVGSDAIVPVISSGNPFLAQIYQQGVSSDELARLLCEPGKQRWGTLLANDQASPVHYYRIADEAVQSQAASFLKADPSVMYGAEVADGKELISALEKDPFGMAFCRLSDVVGKGNKQLVNQVVLLPIDKNRNGSLDPFENIYGSLDEFVRGVWIGKYPKGLTRTIYAMSLQKPSEKAELDFLTWVITGGQELLTPSLNGYLTYGSRQADRISLLTETPAQAEMLAGTGVISHRLWGLSIFSLIILLLIPVILAFIITEVVVRHRNKRYALRSIVLSPNPLLLDENSIKTPAGLYFDKSHTWAFMEQNGNIRIGIDDFLQHITGPLTRIKMKVAGDKVKKGEPVFSVIQNGKQLTIHAPVSGTIKALNNELASDPSMLNNSPYEDGWVYLIEPSNWAREIRLLLHSEKYREWLKTEFSRFKDFIATSLKGANPQYAQVILQDGGEVKDGILADLGPEVWEDFQTSFIDMNK